MRPRRVARRRHLPMQKREKITPSRSSAREFAGDRRQRVLRVRAAPRRRARAAARDASRCARPRARCASRRAQRDQMPLAREERVLHVLVRARDAPASRCSSRSMPAPVFADRYTSRLRPRASRIARCGAMPARSILLCTTTRGSAGGSRARIAASASRAVARRVARIDQHEREIGARDRRPRALDAERLDRSSVSRKPAVSTIVQRNAARSRRRARSVSRVVPAIGVTIADVVAGEPVEQARLADVGPADQHDGRVPRAAARPASRARSTLRAARAIAASLPRASAARRNSMSSSGKSSVASVNIRSSISASTSARDLARELAGQAARRRARRGGGRGVDQVGDALGLREVELAVQERALREFAGLRRGARRARGSARAASRSTARAAVAVQLEHVLAGVRMRRRESRCARPWSSVSPSRAAKRGDASPRAARARGRRRRRSAPRRSAPDTRTMPMPPRPGGVAIAAIVSAAQRHRVRDCRLRARRAARRAGV